MKMPAVTVLLLLLASPVAAQDFYAGLGYDFGMPHSGPDQSITSVFGGVRFGQGPVTYGGELDYGISSGSATDHDSLRLRGVVHNDIGAVGVFGTLGVAQYNLDAGGRAEGFTYGLGMDYDLTDSTAVRLEVIRDIMGSGQPDVTTVRAGVAFNF